jgi:hypothetical protein
LACQVDDLDTQVVIPADVPKGTVVYVKAQVSMLNQACPGAHAIMIAIPIN